MLPIRATFRATPLALAVLLAGALSAMSGCALGNCGTSRTITFRGDLTGAQVVPAVATSMSGGVEMLQLTDERESSGGSDRMFWSFSATALAPQITAIHIHEGKPGQNGRILFTLTERSQPGAGQGIRLNGSVQPYQGSEPFSILFDLLRLGQAYVDIHTEQRPDGELRANLILVQNDDWGSNSCD